MSELQDLLEVMEQTDGATSLPVEPMSKRRKGFPSQRAVKMTSGITSHGEPFQEKLGANDPCPCGSGRKFGSCHMKKRGGWQRGDDYSRSE